MPDDCPPRDRLPGAGVPAVSDIFYSYVIPMSFQTWTRSPRSAPAAVKFR